MIKGCMSLFEIPQFNRLLNSIVALFLFGGNEEGI